MLGQRKLFQKAVPGLMHAAIFWGFIVLLPSIFEASVAIVDPAANLPWLGSAAWFALLTDVFATLVALGVLTAFWIRKVQRPARFEGSHLGEADRILLTILAIVGTLLLWNATRIALGDALHPSAMPVSNLLSGIFGGGPRTEPAERILVWSHLLLVLGFLVYLPGSKHLHILTAAPNVWLAKTGPSGTARAARVRPRRSRGGPAVRRSDRGRSLAQAGARPVQLHRVRTVPGGLSGLGDRASRSVRSS